MREKDQIGEEQSSSAKDVYFAARCLSLAFTSWVTSDKSFHVLFFSFPICKMEITHGVASGLKELII